jgi:hypothetical protein
MSRIPVKSNAVSKPTEDVRRQSLIPALRSTAAMMKSIDQDSTSSRLSLAPASAAAKPTTAAPSAGSKKTTTSSIASSKDAGKPKSYDEFLI